MMLNAHAFDVDVIAAPPAAQQAHIWRLLTLRTCIQHCRSDSAAPCFYDTAGLHTVKVQKLHRHATTSMLEALGHVQHLRSLDMP